MYIIDDFSLKKHLKMSSDNAPPPPENFIFNTERMNFFGHGNLHDMFGKFSFWRKKTTRGGMALGRRIMGTGRCECQMERKKTEEDERWNQWEHRRGPFSDAIDRQNSMCVPGILLFLVLMIQVFCAIQPKHNPNLKGASGPVWCMKSVELSDPEFEFALEYCQSQNHYYVEDHEMINWRKMDTMTRQIGYYHWVQLVLTVQATFFLLPNLLWVYVQNGRGVDFGHFIGWARALSTIPLNYSIRHEKVRAIAAELWALYFPGNINHRHKPRRFFGCTIGRQMDISIVVFYMAFKIFYLLMTIGQFLWLNAFIGDKENFWWGWHIVQHWIRNETWQESRIFPRTTFCAVPFRRMGDAPHYTLQCHLRLNTYNEKIFLFLWWFFLYVAFTTLLNIIYYIYLFLFFPLTCEHSIRRLLRQQEFQRIMASDREEDVQLVDNFSQVHLGCEGMLLLWFIESNAGPIAAREICAHLFDMYSGRQLLHPRNGFDPNPKETGQQDGQNPQQSNEENAGNSGNVADQLGELDESNDGYSQITDKKCSFGVGRCHKTGTKLYRSDSEPIYPKRKDYSRRRRSGSSRKSGIFTKFFHGIRQFIG